MENPLLSVCLITYNHKSFIEQALRSIAMQKVDFSMELIIADDCSNDGTSDVIKEFLRSYNGLVRYLCREKNYGAAGNFIDMISQAKGKYVAYLEGDDYWTSPGKLQQQVSFLEKNDHVVLSSHNSFFLYADGSTILYNQIKKYCNAPRDAVYPVEDYIIRSFIHSSSIVYRRAALPPFPGWYRTAFGGDFYLLLFLGMSGPFHYINEPLSAYRIHGNSISAYSTREEIVRNYEEHSRKFDAYSGGRFHKSLAEKEFSMRFLFYYYHPDYRKKLGFFFSNLRAVMKISETVITRKGRFKMLIPTRFLRSKVSLFTKNDQRV